MLLKVVLFAYSQGIVSSRGIEPACRNQVTFIAWCGDSGPHCTTIAHFLRSVGEDIARVLAAVLAICDRQGLIGREMSAIDGVKLPSNAAKSRGGMRADFARRAAKREAAAQKSNAKYALKIRRISLPYVLNFDCTVVLLGQIVESFKGPVDQIADLLIDQIGRAHV